MKTGSMVAAAMAVLFLTALPGTVHAQPRDYPRPHYGAPPVDRWYLSLAATYDVPYGDICRMHDAGVDDEDMPTILYIYTHSQYSLRQIYSLRLRGATWENLSNWCGVPLGRERVGPPVGNGYVPYRHGHGLGRYRDHD